MKATAAWLPLALLPAIVAACGGEGGDSELMGVAEGKLAPPGAELKWEREIAETTTPAHVIRRYTWDGSPAEVRRFYGDELPKRGWTPQPGASADYAEWKRDGMVLSVLLEPPGGSGSEWSLTLFAAP